MKFLFLIFSTYGLLSTCNSKQITGTYIGHENISITKLTLDSNNRFNYLWEEHMSMKKSSGVWILDNDFIILNSDSSLTSVNGKTKEIYVSGLSEQVVKLFLENKNTPYPNVEATINDSIKMKSDELGKIKIRIPLRSILVNEPDFLVQYHYFVQSKQPIELEVYLTPISNSEIFFSNKKYKVNGQFLIDDLGNKLKRYNSH